MNLPIRMGDGGDVVGSSFWAEVGGHPTFERLVRRFYEGVRTDEVLWPMYPEDDLEGAVQGADPAREPLGSGGMPGGAGRGARA